MTDVLTQPRPIRLKGRSFLALALTPELPFADWLRRLDDLAARSAGFFLRRPVVLDVLPALLQRCRDAGLKPVTLNDALPPRHGAAA